MPEHSSEYAYETILRGLKDAGIRKGDVVLVHSDASAAMALGGFEWWDDAVELLKKCFLDALGPRGTLIVPTFNYDFCKGVGYSHEESLSQVGVFSNSVLSDPRAIRSFQPIFSFAAIGPAAASLFNDLSRSCFGKDSVFHRLHLMNAKIIFFNVNIEFCTFIHYVEQARGVDYRYLKYFTGRVAKQGVEREDTFEYYVRDLEQDVFTHLARLGEDLLSAGLMKKTALAGKYPVYATKADDVFKMAMKELGADPYYLIKDPPKRPVNRHGTIRS